MKAITKTEFLVLLVKLGAHHEVCRWVAEQQEQTAREILRKCQRGDWLLWLASRISINRKLLVFAACQVARTAQQYVPAREPRTLRCIEVAEAWTRGEASLDDVKTARVAAASYAAGNVVSYADTAANAAYANAAYAAYAAAYAATNANAAAYAAASAAYAAASASNVSLATSANLVRKHIPWRVMAAALRGGT